MSLDHITNDLDEFERAIELRGKEVIEKGQLIDGKEFRQQISELIARMESVLCETIEGEDVSNESKKAVSITVDAGNNLLNKGSG